MVHKYSKTENTYKVRNNTRFYIKKTPNQNFEKPVIKLSLTFFVKLKFPFF